MASPKTLHAMFVEELQDLYDAEHQIVEALPDMQKAATKRELTSALKDHLAQTEQHISRLEQVFESLGETPKRKACKGMKGLLTEGKEIIKEVNDKETLDAALIASAQKVEHYEISAYGTLRTWAQTMGHDKEAQFLEQTLNEESQTDERLTQIAESRVNAKAR